MDYLLVLKESPINNLSFLFKKLEKEEQIKQKINRRKYIINNRNQGNRNRNRKHQ